MTLQSYWKYSLVLFLGCFSFCFGESFNIMGPIPFLNATVAVAGSDPEEVTDTSQTYSLESDQGRGVITATLLTPLPSGVSLEVELEKPKKARSRGSVDISDGSEKLLVFAIRKGDYNNLDITYKLKAIADAGLVLPQNLSIEFKFMNRSRR